MLLVYVLTCSGAETVCDPDHARAYQAFVAPPGIVICGSPALIGPVVNSAVGPNPTEYLRVRCEWRQK